MSGLSVAKIVAVDGDAIVLAGADVVDSTPVLDVKPYLPFADGVHDATAPQWVRTGRISVPPTSAASTCLTMGRRRLCRWYSVIQPAVCPALPGLRQVEVIWMVHSPRQSCA